MEKALNAASKADTAILLHDWSILAVCVNTPRVS